MLEIKEKAMRDVQFYIESGSSLFLIISTKVLLIQNVVMLLIIFISIDKFYKDCPFGKDFYHKECPPW